MDFNKKLIGNFFSASLLFMQDSFIHSQLISLHFGISLILIASELE